MQKEHPVYFDLWRDDLGLILGKFQAWRFNTRFYFLKVFLFFVFINDFAYWFAIATAFPEIIAGEDFTHYAKVQVPVAILGALFDSLSLYITLLVVQNALGSRSNFGYISHLSIDVLIAIAATFWVLFVFSISAWVVSFVPTALTTANKTEMQAPIKTRTLSERSKVYEGRVTAAINNPTGKNELKNIYFGIIMGFSAIIPTVVHVFCALFSLRLFLHHEKT